MPRLVFAALMALAMMLPPAAAPVSAASEPDRTLWFHHTHTGETARFTFKRNGQYDPAVLRQMNVFLADWRTKEPTNMDPALFDLLWQIYQAVDGQQPINIVSSYRSPKTNAMLRAKSSGVAENSQHMRGKAMDIFIPGVNLSKLRATAMKFQVGGVGYYPTSGSPFVHVDTGSVRAWPRMTRAQLLKVFPDGKTLHLPTDGKPISAKGRAYAEAEWSKCHTVPCNSGVAFSDGPEIMLADNGADAAPIPLSRPGDRDSEILLASAEPAQRLVKTVDVVTPVPLARPGEELQVAALPLDAEAFDAAGAPVPLDKPARIQLATREPLDVGGETALAALNALEPLPKPRLLLSDKLDEVVTAYVPAGQDPEAERALRMIIGHDDAMSGVLTPAPDAIQTASLGGGKLKGMLDMTFDALGANEPPQPIVEAVADLALSKHPNTSIEMLPVELVAPEIDHVNETLVEPQLMTAAFWTDMTEAEGYLEKGTALGPLTGMSGFVPDSAPIPAYDRFVTASPQLLVAAR